MFALFNVDPAQKPGFLLARIFDDCKSLLGDQITFFSKIKNILVTVCKIV